MAQLDADVALIDLAEWSNADGPARPSPGTAVIVLAEDDKTFRSILVYGLTGWIQQKTGRLSDIDDHMMRNAMGDRDKRRETE